MKKTYRLTSIFLLTAILVSGCSNKAAIVVNRAKVQHVLLFVQNDLNDRDKMNR